MRTTNMPRVSCTVLLAVLCFACVARGQSETATVSGLVTDSSGAIVPKADVQLQSVNRGTVATATTNGAGIYVFASVQPGPYQLTVRKAGFKQVDLLGVIINTQDHIEQNFKLELGSVSESVTVTADTTNINTTDATVSTTIDRNFAENLPLNGRSFQTLILLTPGTVLSGAGNSFGTFSVNGQRTNSNSFSVDGVSANLGGFLAGVQGSATTNGANPDFTNAGTTQGMVSVDALQEFKIQTSTYAPEFGRQPGGQVSLLTRSGTNSFHGTAFDYFRNTVLDANNWFNDAADLPKAPERQNDFGGTFGGPIFKDKTFFFFSYEGLRLLAPFTENFVVPSLSLRQGAATSFQPIMNSFPIPNGPVSGDGAVFTLDTSRPTNFDSYAIKVDHTFGSRVHIFGRYSDVKSNFEFIAPGDVESDKFESRVLTVGGDFSVSPTLSNELRLNYTVNPSTSIDQQLPLGEGKPFDASILFPPPFALGVDRATFRISLPDLFYNDVLGPFSTDSQRQANVLDNVSLTIGSHQLKWGVDYRRLFPILAVRNLVSYSVNSVSDLDAGNVSDIFTEGEAVAHPIYTNFSAYTQDTWRVGRRFTLTYGLRWELNPTPGERDGLNKFIPNVIGINDPATAMLAPAGSPLFKTTYDNFAPRIGAAYQIRQSPKRETVVRAGIGIFYDLNSQTVAQNEVLQRGFANDSPDLFGVSFPVASNVLTIPPVPVPRTPPFVFVDAIDPNLKLPYTLQWNVSLEQGLGQSQSLRVSYVASAGYDLLRQDTLESFSSTFKNLAVLRNASSSSYQSLQIQFNRQLSRGLQALASYTYSHCIDDASDGQTVITAFQVLPNPNEDRGDCDFDLRQALRGALTYNIPTWNASHLSRGIFSGWAVEMIGLAQSGSPVDLLGGFTNFGTVRPDIVPGQPFYLYGAQCTSTMQALGELAQGHSCPGGMALNPAAFISVPTDSQGNAIQQGTLGRNVIRGFGAWQMDFALHRQFNLTDRVNLQFRSEFFNLFNHPNFGSMDTFVGDGTFGLATSTLNGSLGGLNSLYQIGGPRSIQLALKLSF
jgi:hypothetical protein